jgi:uncharacterized protein (DUF1778 family)
MSETRTLKITIERDKLFDLVALLQTTQLEDFVVRMELVVE